MAAESLTRIASIQFHQFKAFSRYKLKLDHMNILVGPNNSGKSTIIGAVRALATGLRAGRTRAPERLDLSVGRKVGYRLSEASLPMSLENVHTDYGAGESHVIFTLSNENTLKLLFPAEGGCVLLPEAQGIPVTTIGAFKRHFPLSLSVVPVLGPVEHREERREKSTVVEWLSTHRASRHFRSYWHYFPEGFEAFATLVRTTWPGMEIRAPELTSSLTNELSMFCLEERLTRELYWVGFGFQVWCQLLTHVSRAKDSTLLVVDEPEVYLHPDVQRQLLAILRDVGPDILLATHSTEIMAEADASEIVLIDKRAHSGERLKDVAGVQKALDSVGSIQNIALTTLARNRRVLFVEGEDDFRLLRRFAKRLGMSDLAAGFGITPLMSGGFGSWQRITTLASGIAATLGTSLAIGAVYDRDYFCDEEILQVATKLSTSLQLAHVHERKEIENYLLVPAALDRALERAIADRLARGDSQPIPLPAATILLAEITEPMRDDVQSQLIARRTSYLRTTGKDLADITRETLASFSAKWADLARRLHLVSGKAVLGAFRDRVQRASGISLSDARIVDALHKDEISPDMVRLLKSLDEFRKQSPKA